MASLKIRQNKNAEQNSKIVSVNFGALEAVAA
jgi:hypothetical protein